MATQGHKLAAAGATFTILEPAFAFAHTGAVGAIVGLALAGMAYASVDDLERAMGRELAPLPTSAHRMNAADDEWPLWKRLLVGKSAREPQSGNITRRLDNDPEPAGTEQALADAEAGLPEQGVTHYVTDDPAFALYLGSNFAPDVNMVLAEGIFCSGMKGSGKTEVCALISEQIGRYPDAAQVVFDSQGDLLSLLSQWPNGRMIDAQNWYSAEEIITNRYQVVVNLQEWETAEEQAQIIIALVTDLIAYTRTLHPDDRIPCPVFLDEAQSWLPEKRVAYLSQDAQQQLSDAFNILLAQGRKRGLTPFLFTQRIAQIQKTAISCGIQVFMRVVLDNDTQRCTEYVRSDVLKKDQFPALGVGHGVVCLPGGVQVIVGFNRRRSVHVSHTPKVGTPAQPTRRLPETAVPLTPRIIPEQRAYIPERPAATQRLPEPEPRPMPRTQPTQSRPSPALSPRLQKALEAYQAGNTSSRTLGEALGFKKDVGADLLRQLRERRLID